MNVVNPWDGGLVGTYTATTRAELDASLTLLEQGRATFQTLTAYDRAQILRRLAALLEANTDSLAAQITQEMGKVITEARGEIQRAVNTIQCSADEALQIRGEVLDSDAYPPLRGRWGIVQRRPIGIVLAITPFNFPINLAVHKLGPAFAAGCPVLFKPGPANALSGRRLVELAHEAGFPPSTLQWAVPDLPDLREVVAGDRIAAISFTGGVGTARAIARDAGFKKLLFELGGNDPLIVFDDADLDRAVDTAIQQRFGTAGQRCTASKRVFVHQAVYARFRDLLVERSAKLAVGDPMDGNTFIGPVVSGPAADQIVARIDAAKAAGATVALGGTREGNVIAPTILEGVPDSAELVADETFGPVLPLFSFADEAELIRRVNQTPFGLQAGVFTQDIDRVKRLYEALDVGALAVNDGPGFRAEHFPFGGVKNSGLGREGVRYCIEELTVLKTLVW